MDDKPKSEHHHHHGHSHSEKSVKAPEEAESDSETQAAVEPKKEIPPGLEPLVKLDKMMVKQELELVEIYCNCEGKNRYSIRDGHGREIMNAKETTCCCWMRCCCCNKTRPFGFTIDDFENHEIYLSRNLACNTCFCPLCLNKVKVTMKNGITLGYVKQRWSLFCSTNYYIKDGDGENILKINGPCCTFSCCCRDVTFTIKNMQGEEVGKISKKWGGILKEVFTDADSFGITFPVDLDVKIKAVLMAAAILIDFMFFEDNSKVKPNKT